jgi:hypothetical protein
LALGVLLLVVMVASRWWYVWLWPSCSWGTAIFNGCLCVTMERNDTPTWPMWTIEYDDMPDGLHWWFDWERGNPSESIHLLMPLWFLALFPLSASFIAWRLDRRARRCAGLCRRCGYDRAGLAVSAVCPECGAATKETTARTTPT